MCVCVCVCVCARANAQCPWKQPSSGRCRTAQIASDLLDKSLKPSNDTKLHPHHQGRIKNFMGTEPKTIYFSCSDARTSSPGCTSARTLSSCWLTGRLALACAVKHLNICAAQARPAIFASTSTQQEQCNPDGQHSILMWGQLGPLHSRSAPCANRTYANSHRRLVNNCLNCSIFFPARSMHSAGSTAADAGVFKAGHLLYQLGSRLTQPYEAKSPQLQPEIVRLPYCRLG